MLLHDEHVVRIMCVLTPSRGKLEDTICVTPIPLHTTHVSSGRKTLSVPSLNMAGWT